MSKSINAVYFTANIGPYLVKKTTYEVTKELEKKFKKASKQIAEKIAEEIISTYDIRIEFVAPIDRFDPEITVAFFPKRKY